MRQERSRNLTATITVVARRSCPASGPAMFLPQRSRPGCREPVAAGFRGGADGIYQASGGII
jgi:hypothetical protein